MNSRSFILILCFGFLAACADGGPATVERQSVSTPTPTTTFQPSPIPKPPTPTATHTNTPDKWADIDPSDQTIVFWHNYLYEREEAIKQIISEFNKTNAYNITVTAQFRGGADDIFDAARDALKTEQMPDLVVGFDDHTDTYADNDVEVELISLLESVTWGIDDLTPYYSDLIVDTEDTFPAYRSLDLMYVNLDWLSSLELSFDGLPESPEQFHEAACLAAQEPGKTGYAIRPGASNLVSWVFAFNGAIYDGTGYTFDSAEAIEASAYLQSLVNDGCASLITEPFGDQDLFGAGSSLFSMGTSSGLIFYEREVNRGAQFEWTVTAPPHSTTDPVVNVFGPSLIILDNSPERRLAAWIFVKELTSTEAQSTWVQASNYLPIRRDLDLGPFLAENPVYAEAYNLMPYGVPEPSPQDYDQVRGLMSDAAEDILRGADIEERLNQLTLASNAILNAAQ